MDCQYPEAHWGKTGARPTAAVNLAIRSDLSLSDRETPWCQTKATEGHRETRRETDRPERAGSRSCTGGADPEAQERCRVGVPVGGGVAQRHRAE